MSSVLSLMFSVLVPLVAGYALAVLLLGFSRSWLSLRLAVAYPLGLGLLTHWMLLLDVCGQRFHLLSIALPALPAAMLILGMAAHRGFRQADNPAASEACRPRRRAVDALLIVAILAGGFYMFWRALVVPVQAFDVLSTTGLRGKIFFFDRSLARLVDAPHAAYPPLLPLAQVWTALCLGDWHESFVKLPVPMMVCGYLVHHHRFLRERVNLTWSLLGNTLLLSAGFFLYHATIAYRDVTLACFNGGTVLLLLTWSRHRRAGLLIAAGLLSAFGCFTKLDGLLYAAVHAVLLVYLVARSGLLPGEWKTALRQGAGYAAAAGLLPLGYFVYKVALGIPLLKQGAAVDVTSTSFQRLPLIAWSFVRDLFLRGNWNLVWGLVAISLWKLRTRHRDVEVQVLLMGLSLSLLAVFLLLLLTPYYAWISEAGRSTALLSRMLLHSFPLAPALIVLANARCSPVRVHPTAPK